MSINRPSWDEYFMGLAFLVSQRSCDGHTQHGCLLVDKNRHIIGTGYNSFPRGMDDNSLPLCRPSESIPFEDSKYPWMAHAERNALANLTISPWLIPGGATAYITGQPCQDCAIQLWQTNVTTWFIAHRPGSALLNDKTKRNFDRLVQEANILVIWMKPNLNWLVNDKLIGNLKELGFVNRD